MYPIPFQGDFRSFDVYIVSIDLPKYRLDNVRTLAAQLEHISKNNLSNDYFSSDSERDDVQRVQHGILLEMGKEAGLEKHLTNLSTRQTEPLILTNDGFLANGNRRLAIIRHLYDRDPKKYSHYQSVRVIILPLCDKKDILDLEAKLQLQEDYKARYRWTTHALAMRKAMRDFKYKPSVVGKMYGGLKAKNVEEAINALESAESYLLSRKIPCQYSIVNDNEYAFREIVKQQKRFSGDIGKMQQFKESAYLLIDEVGSERLFREIKKLADNFQPILTQMEEDHIEIFTSQWKTENEMKPKEDDSSEVFSVTSYKPIKTIDINNIGDDVKKDIRNTIRDTIQREENFKAKEKREYFVRDRVREAHTILQDVTINLTKDMSKEGFTEQLKEISHLVIQIQKWLNDNS